MKMNILWIMQSVKLQRIRYLEQEVVLFFRLSDLLGDDKYYFIIYNSAEFQSNIYKNINVAISRINTKGRTNYGYGIFHYIGRRYDIAQSDDFFYERSFGGYFSLLYTRFHHFNDLKQV